METLKPKNNLKRICFTIDVEPDYGRLDSFEVRKNIDPLVALFRKYNLPLTVFVVTKVLNQYPEIVDKFKQLNCQFEPHSHYHRSHNSKKEIVPEEQIQDIRESKNAYIDFFKKMPQTYRFPQGVTTPKEIDFLKENGFKYDSSVYPSWRPKLYNNLKYPSQPFRHENGFLEIPFSGIPVLKLPYALSYMQFFGWNFYHLISSIFGLPPTIVFGFHLHNLTKISGVTKGFPLDVRLFYIRNQNNGFKILEKFIKYSLKKGYQPSLISDLAGDYLD